jgi:hypothetical protein
VAFQKDRQLLYRLDFKYQDPFVMQFTNRNGRREGVGDVPKGFKALASDNSTKGEVLAERVEGRVVMGLRNVSGKDSVQFESTEPLVRLTQGKRFVIRVEYLTRGNALPRIRLDNGRHPNTLSEHFPKPSEGRWAQFETTLVPTTDVRLMINFQNGAVGADDIYYIKAIEVEEVAGGVAAGTKEFPRLDLSEQQPFTQRIRNANVLQTTGGGSLPPGWRAYAWGSGALMEVCAEQQLGEIVLGIKNLEGAGSTAMLFTNDFPLEPGHRYKARFEYLNRGGARGALRFTEGNLAARDLCPLLSATGKWTLQEVEVTVPQKVNARWEFHNHVVGPENGIYVRSFEVQDLGT